MPKVISISLFQIQSFCKGDNDALSPFFNEELNKMVFYAYSFVKDKELASDVVFDVIEKLLSFGVEERQKRMDLEPLHFKNTIYLILRNKCLDHIKIEENRKRILQDKFYLNGSVAQNNAEEVFIKDSFLSLTKQIGKQQNRVLQMHLDGYDNNEIAKELEINYNTVRNTLSTTKKKIKELWTSFFEG